MLGLTPRPKRTKLCTAGSTQNKERIGENKMPRTKKTDVDTTEKVSKKKIKEKNNQNNSMK